MASLPTVNSLPASTFILDDSDTTFINYTAPFSKEPNLTCRGNTCTEILGVNGSLQFSFQGTDVWLFGKPPGLARIFLNGALVQVLDTTAAMDANTALWGANNLDGKATHVLKIGGIEGEGLNVLIDFFAIQGTVLSLSSLESSTTPTGYDPTPAERRKLTGILVGTLFGFFVFLLLAGGGLFLYIRRKKQQAGQSKYGAQNEKSGAVGSKNAGAFGGVFAGISSFFSGLSRKSKLRGKHGTLPLIKLIRPRQTEYHHNPSNSTDGQSQQMFYRTSTVANTLASPGSTNDPFRPTPYMIPVPGATIGGMNANGYNATTDYPSDTVSPPPPNQPLVVRNAPYAPPSPPYSDTSSSAYPYGGVAQWHPYTLAIASAAAPAPAPPNLRTGAVLRAAQDEETTPLMETPPDYPFQSSNRAPAGDQKARPAVSLRNNNNNGGAVPVVNEYTHQARPSNGEGSRGGQEVSFTASVLGVSPSTPTPAYSSWAHAHPYSLSPSNNGNGGLVPPFTGGSESTFGPSRPFDSHQDPNSLLQAQGQIPAGLGPNQRQKPNGRGVI
ncbi:hypothetical protein FRC14_005172 [Serendipita sp. 396]|nr:hypothetical protein FRC14_005172 [Serendipita sp. 396]KAG8828159.1 hypothetical protein FRC19_009243 [Serendipita sp. 401]KAG8829428.1 hypothetical protein FRC18_009322 [Serendipita sp. 400]KAG8852455.1 hypothetical protein FRC20_001496 [Serendipita sp. 405]KAG9058464.1 hypothetical protein FS842_009532 [Serendipita sp. 407]